MGKTVAELLAGKPQPLAESEGLYWMAYYELEPFGPVQEDFRAGQVASLIYNANRGKDAKVLGPEAFFPSLQEPEEITREKDRAEQVWRARIWTALMKQKARRETKGKK